MATELSSRDAAATPAAGERPGVRARPRHGVWWCAYRHHLRLLRTTAIAWTVVLAGIGTGVVTTYEERLPTETERAAADALEGVPAFEAVFGRFVQPGSLEGFVLSRWTGIFALFVAVWGLLGATKLLRGEEDIGHTEPLRAGPLSPRALLGAAVAAMLSWFTLFAVTVGLTHSAAGMDAATSWVLGVAMALLAASFAAVGTVTSQLAAPRRRATQLAGAVLAAALVARVLAAATTTPDWVWWTTPFGWIGFLHESDAARVAVLTAFVLLVVGLFALALSLAARDLHGAVVGRVGRVAPGTRGTRGQLGLAIRLTGSAALGWAVGLAGVAFVFALLTDEFAAAMADMPGATAVYEQMGYPALATAQGFVTLILGWFFFAAVALHAAAQVTSIRDEEASWRLEHLLVRPVGRVGWLATRTLAAAGGIVLIASAVGAALVVGTALGGTALPLDDALLAAVNLVPAAWLFLGIGILLFGLTPRLTGPLAFGAVIAAYLLDLVGPLLELPAWLVAVSPFHHLAPVPAADLEVASAVVMVAIGALAAGGGLVAFRLRDLQEA